MSERSSWGNFVAVLLLLAAYAYAPVISMPIAGEDVPTLIGARELTHSGSLEVGDLYRVPGIEGRPGAALSLALSSLIWAPDGQWSAESARRARIENLVLLLLSAFFLVPLVRRALQPWTPLDQGKGAGFAAALLFAIHPFAVLSAARLASRGDLLAVMLSMAALASFLHGRQERDHGRVLLAAALTIIVGFFSGVDIFIPFAVAILEFLSARRHRPHGKRVRTMLNTLVGFSACVAIGWGLRSLLGAEGSDVLSYRGGSTLDLASVRGDGVVLGLEKLGLLILPVNSYGSGAPGYLLAGLAILIGLQPALVAGRWAPRLWGWILFGWILSIAASQVPDAIVRVEPHSLVGAEVLLVPSLVMALGLGISSTALSGVRRYLTPILVGGMYASLAHSGVTARALALGPVERLHEELLLQVLERGGDELFVVVDPPATSAGYDPLGNVLPWLLHPAFLPPELERTTPVQLFGLDRLALRAWLREADFADARQNGLVLLVPAAQLQGLEEPDGPAGASWIAVDVPASEPSRGRRIWRGEGRSPSGVEFEPWTARAIVTSAMPDIATDELPMLRWNARSTLYHDAQAQGRWLTSPDGPVAVFDMADNWDWLLGERIKRMWSTGELASMVSTQVFADLPQLVGELEPKLAGDDWVFDLSSVDAPVARGATCRLVLLLFDCSTLDFVELPGRENGSGKVQFGGAQERVQHALEAGAGPITWILEWRIDDVTVGQRSGQRATSYPVRDDG
ncbi:MAG: hypothetical protein ACI8QZ_000280 [Chlamydiales bacterium]|jgi:hypothetical protein